MPATAQLPAAPSSLDAIRAPVEADLRGFRDHFRDAMKTRVRLLDSVIRYVLRRKGKEIRPTLVLLAADLAGGVTDKSLRAAALVELLHTATLVHDDVVDEADTRRGVASINALWKNKVGVLLGDYLLSRGLLLALDAGDYDLLHVVSDAVRRMAEGELLQIQTSKTLAMTEERYYRIIADKTGSLIAACLAAGAASAGADDEAVARARAIGEEIGLAFQIRDDLFDYDADASVGKPIGLDLQDRKLTLPMILALDAAEPGEAKRVRRLVRRRKKSAADVREALDFVRRHGGIDASRERMQGHAQRASELLHAFPPSDARDALDALCAYVVARNR